MRKRQTRSRKRTEEISHEISILPPKPQTGYSCLQELGPGLFLMTLCHFSFFISDVITVRQRENRHNSKWLKENWDSTTKLDLYKPAWYILHVLRCKCALQEAARLFPTKGGEWIWQLKYNFSPPSQVFTFPHFEAQSWRMGAVNLEKKIHESPNQSTCYLEMTPFSFGKEQKGHLQQGGVL